MPSWNAVIAVGANLGDRRAALQGALDGLRATPGIDVLAVSSLYETDPVGGPEQPEYANAVIRVRSTISARGLLDRAHELEADWERTRQVRWGPRTLDIDIPAQPV